MSQEELADSIEQLEQELRAVDKNGSGFLPQEEFAMVLLQNGGLVEQTEALIEQFGGAVDGSVCYVDLINGMRYLADADSHHDGNTTLRKVGDVIAGSHTMSPPSGGNSTPTKGMTRGRVQSSSKGIAPLRKDNLVTRSLYTTAPTHDRSFRARDNSHELCVSVEGPNAASTTLLGSSANQRFALPQNRGSVSRVNGQQHRALLGSGSDGMRAPGLLEKVRECTSSTMQRASSVERMLQQAKLRAVSESVTPTRSETANGGREGMMMLRDKSVEQREREVFCLPGRQKNWTTSVKCAEASGGLAMQTPTPGCVAALGPTSASITSGARSNDMVSQHDTSRVSHGASTTGSSWRGDLISLREVFRVIDRDQDGFVTLREVWAALHRRGVEVQLLELEALADSLDLDLPDTSNTDPMRSNLDDVDVCDSANRMLGIVDFCMLVSRMRSSLIERIRRAALWVTREVDLALDLSPPPALPTRYGADRACIAECTMPLLKSGGNTQLQSVTPTSALRNVPPSLLSALPCHQAPQSPGGQQNLSQLNVNSLSPPPSVHTSIVVSHLAESGLAETPQNRGTAGAARITCHQLASGSTVSLSPSPEMERTGSSQEVLTSRDGLFPSSRFSAGTLMEGEVKNDENNEKQAGGEKRYERSVVAMSSSIYDSQSAPATTRSHSPHPYDVAAARGLQCDIEETLPPSHAYIATDKSTEQPSISMTAVDLSHAARTGTSCGGSAVCPVKRDYSELHRSIVERQRQRVAEEDFLNRLETEFQERYGRLIDDEDVAPTEALQHPQPLEKLTSNCMAKVPPTSPETFKKPINRSVSGGSSTTAAPVAHSSACSSVNSPPECGSSGIARLLRPTASSRAHERNIKFTYCPSRRATSSGRGSGGDAVGQCDGGAMASSVTSSNTTCIAGRSRSLSADYERRPPKAASSRASVRNGRDAPGKSIRSMRQLSPPQNDASTISHRSRSGGGEVGPGVVRVSLLPSSNAVGDGSGERIATGEASIPQGAASNTATTATTIEAPMHQTRRQSPGIPPRPPTRLHDAQDQAKDDEARRGEMPQLSQQISLKLYGKCSQLLSLCSNYDRTHDGLLSPKDLGRALYTVAPDLTEAEIGDLIRAALAKGGKRCHYVSLVSDLVVKESYVRFYEDADDADRVGKATLDSPARSAGPSPVNLSEAHVTAAARSPPIVYGCTGGNTGNSTLEDRVRKGRLKMNRLLREELLSSCGGDYRRLRDTFFAHDDVRTGYLEEKIFRKCIVKIFRCSQRVMPAWVLDRCVHLCRSPFEREILADNDKTVAPPPAVSQEEESARRRVHGIPKLLWSVLCDYRYMLEELHL